MAKKLLHKNLQLDGIRSRFSKIPDVACLIVMVITIVIKGNILVHLFCPIRCNNSVKDGNKHYESHFRVPFLVSLYQTLKMRDVGRSTR